MTTSISSCHEAHANFQKEPNKTVGAVAYTKYYQYIDIDSIECKSSHPGKSDKYLSEDYIKTDTMTKACAKFQKSQHKMVGGFAHTRYPVSDLVPLVVNA